MKCLDCNSEKIYCKQRCSKCYSRLPENKEKRKKYYQNNKEKLAANDKKWRENNKEKMKEIHRIYEETNKEEIAERKKEYYKNNKDIIDKRNKEYSKTPEGIRQRRERDNKRRECLMFRLNGNMSSGIRISLKRDNLSKSGRHWEDLVGYTTKELKSHIEKLFTKGMNWENYGEWHIDHITPKSFFKYKSTDDVEFRYCWSLNNLQPLWAADNIRKSDKIVLGVV